jgi:hypothetical protein
MVSHYRLESQLVLISVADYEILKLLYVIMAPFTLAKGLRTCGAVTAIELNSPWYRLTPPL